MAGMGATFMSGFSGRWASLVTEAEQFKQFEVWHINVPDYLVDGLDW